VIDKQAMQDGTADSEGRATGEDCFGSLASIQKTNALEWLAHSRRDGDAEVAQRSNTIGHETLAAGLVDGRNCAVSDSNAEAAPTRRDRGGDARWAPSYDQDIDCILRVQ